MKSLADKPARIFSMNEEDCSTSTLAILGLLLYHRHFGLSIIDSDAKKFIIHPFTQEILLRRIIEPLQVCFTWTINE